MTLETPLRALHQALGAEMAAYFDCLLPDRFSDSETEYHLARSRVALVDTGYRAYFHFDGPDRVRYLNAVLTNNIKDLAAGQSTTSLLLNPQGHILAEVETYALPERLLAACHAMVRERTLSTLEKFIIMDEVSLEDVTDRTGSIALEGPEAPAVLRELAGTELETLAPGDHLEADVGSIPCRVVRRSLFGQIGAEFMVDRARVETLWQTLLEAARERGGGPIGYAALNMLRLEAGIAWFGHDFDDKVIPHEAALEASHISYTKGCYTGQEIVERVRSRGHVNRRRVGLQFLASTAPARGAKLLADGKEAGYVTSGAYSPALRRAIGMGYVRREHISLGSVLTCDTGEAEVIELPLASLRAATR